MLLQDKNNKKKIFKLLLEPKFFLQILILVCDQFLSNLSINRWLTSIFFSRTWSSWEAAHSGFKLEKTVKQKKIA